MGVKLSIENKVMTAFIEGDIDHHTAKEIREIIDANIGRYSPKLLYLDFSGVPFMDSSGIGLIMGRYKVLSETGGRVYAVEVNESVKRIFRMSGLFKIVEVFDNLDELICMQRI